MAKKKRDEMVDCRCGHEKDAHTAGNVERYGRCLRVMGFRETRDYIVPAVCDCDKYTPNR